MCNLKFSTSMLKKKKKETDEVEFNCISKIQLIKKQIAIKITNEILHILFLLFCLQMPVCILNLFEHLTLNWPHFKRSIATCGQCLLYDTAQQYYIILLGIQDLGTLRPIATSLPPGPVCPHKCASCYWSRVHIPRLKGGPDGGYKLRG